MAESSETTWEETTCQPSAVQRSRTAGPETSSPCPAEIESLTVTTTTRSAIAQLLTTSRLASSIRRIASISRPVVERVVNRLHQGVRAVGGLHHFAVRLHAVGDQVEHQRVVIRHKDTYALARSSHRLFRMAPRLARLRPAIVPASAADFFHQVKLGNLHALLESFAHVVDGQRRGGGGHKRLHLHAGRSRRGDARADLDSILAQPRSHINVRQRQRVTKRYPLRGAFGRGNPGNPRDFQRIPFRRLQSADGPQRRRGHPHEAVSDGGSRGGRLRADVHHGHFAALPVVCQLTHSVGPPLTKLLASAVLRPIPRPPVPAFPAAPPDKRWPAPVPRYRRNPSRTTPGRSARRCPIRCARVKNASAALSAAPELRGVPETTRAGAASLRSAGPSPAARTAQTSPSSRRDSPAGRTPAFLGTSRTRPASRDESPRRRNRIPPRDRAKPFPPGHTSPWKPRRKGSGCRPRDLSRFSCADLQLGRRHFPEAQARLRQAKPAPRAKCCCYCGFETAPVSGAPALLHLRSKELPRSAFSPQPASCGRLARLLPVRHSRAASPERVMSAPRGPRCPSRQYFVPIRRCVRRARAPSTAWYARSSPRHRRRAGRPRRS